MPPVGQKVTCGKTERSAFTWPGPPAEAAGKTFTTSVPAARAARTSVGVTAPSIRQAPASRQGGARLESTQGATRKRAPAARQASAVAASGTVPAPTSRSGSAASSRIRSTAPGTVMVISKTVIPVSRSQATAVAAWAVFLVRTTGTIRAASSWAIRGWLMAGHTSWNNASTSEIGPGRKGVIPARGAARRRRGISCRERASLRGCRPSGLAFSGGGGALRDARRCVPA